MSLDILREKIEKNAEFNADILSEEIFKPCCMNEFSIELIFRITRLWWENENNEMTCDVQFSIANSVLSACDQKMV